MYGENESGIGSNACRHAIDLASGGGVVRRGEIWWASLPAPHGSSPGSRRPVVVVQSNDFNESRIQTVIVAAVTSNLRLGDAPGNFALSSRGTGLPRKSVVSVSQLATDDVEHSVHPGMAIVMSPSSSAMR